MYPSLCPSSPTGSPLFSLPPSPSPLSLLFFPPLPPPSPSPLSLPPPFLLFLRHFQAPNCNFLENVDTAQRHAFRRMVIDMVLATDMARHLEHLGELKTLLETKKVANEGILVLDKYKDRLEV